MRQKFIFDLVLPEIVSNISLESFSVYHSLDVLACIDVIKRETALTQLIQRGCRY